MFILCIFLDLVMDIENYNWITYFQQMLECYLRVRHAQSVIN